MAFGDLAAQGEDARVQLAAEVKVHAGDRRKCLAERMEATPGRFLVIFSLIFVIAQTCENLRRPFWFDELMTVYLADLPSISQIWSLIQSGIELNPPLPFWITWILHHTFGEGEAMTRLPALAGFWLMCICLFYFVRRRSDAVHGFLAMLLPLFTFTEWHATWARGYGLMLGFSAAALLCWQLATDGVRRAWALTGLAVGIGAAVSCHYYAVYIAFAIGIGELVRTFARKKIDPPVIAAILLGISPLAAYRPLLHALPSASQTFWISPKSIYLYDSYADLFGPVAMVIILWVAVTLWRSRSEETRILRWRVSPLAAGETAACLTLAAMPLLVFLAAFVTPIAFYYRYVQPVVIGFSVLLVMFVYRIGLGKRFRNLAASLLVWFCLTPWAVWQVAKMIVIPPPAQQVIARLDLPQAPSVPIIVDNDNDFLTLLHYAPPALCQKLFMLLDSPASIEYLGSDTAQRSMRLAQTFRDIHVMDYKQFTSQYPEFLLCRSRPEGWILQKLLADGANVNLLKQRRERGYFVEDSLLFRVRMPASPPRPQ